MRKKIYKILCISTLLLSALFTLGDTSTAHTNTTNIFIPITPGDIDYNVSGSITLWGIIGSVNSVVLTGTFSTGSFWAKDLSGTYYVGPRYRKISSSQMVGQYNGGSIPTSTYYVIRPNTSIAVTYSGTATSGANIVSSSGRLDLSNLQQQTLMTLSDNSGFLYRVSITPSIAINIPAGQQVDTYKAVLTVTVPWS